MIKMTNLEVKKIDLEIEKPLAVINSKTLDELKIKPSSRIKIKNESYELMCEVVSSNDLVPPNSVGIKEIDIESLNVVEGQKVSIFMRRRPASLEHVKNKRTGSVWKDSQIRAIVNDITVGNYTDLEISMFTLAQYYLGLNMDEITNLTQYMAESGTTLDFEEPVYDKHSIGGVNYCSNSSSCGITYT